MKLIDAYGFGQNKGEMCAYNTCQATGQAQVKALIWRKPLVGAFCVPNKEQTHRP